MQPIKQSLVDKLKMMPLKRRKQLFSDLLILYQVVRVQRHECLPEIEMREPCRMIRQEIQQRSRLGGFDITPLYKFVIDNCETTYDLNRKFRHEYF